MCFLNQENYNHQQGQKIGLGSFIIQSKEDNANCLWKTFKDGYWVMGNAIISISPVFPCNISFHS